MIFGAYEPYVVQTSQTPFDCLRRLPKHGLIIKQGAQNRYVAIFRSTTDLPFMKRIDVVNGLFQVGKDQFQTFDAFLSYYRADVKLPTPIINRLINREAITPPTH